MKARRDRRPIAALVAALVVGLLMPLALVTPASASISGTFVPVAVPASCTLAGGYSSTGSLCGAGLGGNMYIYLPTSGSSLTYSFTVPTGASDTLTYGIPAGGFVNNVAATISLDGGSPATENSDLGPFNQTVPTDVALWTSPPLAAGPHTWTITSSGDSVNLYGLWLSQVGVTVPCDAGTTDCSATLSVPTQTVTVAGAKPSPTPATITVQVATATLSCQNFNYAAPVVTLTDTGLQSGTAVTVVETVAGLPSAKGVLVCYQPSGNAPPPPVLLKKCHGKKFKGACIESLVEGTGIHAGSVVATLLVPAGDPRFHVGGGAPVITSFSPASPKAGKKLTVKGANLSEVTAVTIGGTPARIVKATPTKVSVIAPALAHGVISVTSLAGVARSAGAVTVG